MEDTAVSLCTAREKTKRAEPCGARDGRAVGRHFFKRPRGGGARDPRRGRALAAPTTRFVRGWSCGIDRNARLLRGVRRPPPRGPLVAVGSLHSHGHFTVPTPERRSVRSRAGPSNGDQRALRPKKLAENAREESFRPSTTHLNVCAAPALLLDAPARASRRHPSNPSSPHGCRTRSR